MGDRSSDMTLAFTLEALRRLANPRGAVEDARTWSEYVGAVSSEPNGALSFTQDRRIRLDFFSGTRPPAEALYGAQTTYSTERHVLVGVPEQDSLAQRGWEFQAVSEAAERAGWELAAESDDSEGSVGRLVDRLRRVVGV